jgi:hypothetical protein
VVGESGEATFSHWGRPTPMVSSERIIRTKFSPWKTPVKKI